MSTKHRPQQVAPKPPFCPLSVKMKLELLTLNLVPSVLTHKKSDLLLLLPLSRVGLPFTVTSLPPPLATLHGVSAAVISARKAFPSSNVVTFKGWLSWGRRDSPMATEHTALVEDHCVLSTHLRQLSNACSPRESDTL